MKKLISALLLLLFLCFSLSILVGETPDPAKDKAKQQELLAAALKEFDSPDKVRSLLTFLDSPYPEISAGALKALRELPAYCTFGPATDALRARTRVAREYAAEALGAAGNDNVFLPLLKVVINDPQETVRQKALDSLLNLTTRGKLITNFNDVLKQEGVGPYHIRAAGSIGQIGQFSDRAVSHLVERLKIIRIWPAGPRVHVFFGEMFTYIKDFDIVLTNAAASQTMSDPVPSTIYTGVTLDVRITKVEEFITIERDVIMQGLGRISGKDFGTDSKRWIDWWAGENSKTFTQRYAERKAAVEQFEVVSKESNAAVEKLLNLGAWCRELGQETAAAQEFTAVLAKDNDNAPARSNLNDMGYALYDGQCQEIPKILPVGERAVHLLLNQLKSYDENKRWGAQTRLAGIEPVFKLRPFIKTIQSDPVAPVRAYVAEGLAGIKEPKVIPYLVKASLDDDAESVRTSAFNALAKFGIRETIPWYVYLLENSPDAVVQLRASEKLGEIGVGDKLSAIALLRQIYWIHSAKQFINIPIPALPSLPALGVHQKDNLTFGTLIIELPDKKLGTPRPQGSLKTADDTLLKATADVLAKVTRQNFGTDCIQWLTWWNKTQSDK